MTKVRPKPVEQDPVGIVISEGKRVDAEPRLLAYIWGETEPTPEVPAEVGA